MASQWRPISRPERVRKEKPRVSAFTSVRIAKILELKPVLSVGFSHMQPDMAAKLVQNSEAIHIFMQRKVVRILSMIWTPGIMLGISDQTDAYTQELYPGGLRESAANEANQNSRRTSSIHFAKLLIWCDALTQSNEVLTLTCPIKSI